MQSFLNKIDKTWSLFLDRDGVINRRIPDDYVKDFSDFEFIPGNLEAIAVFDKIFSTIVVVTNQQGIGRGLMTTEQLNIIHQEMISEIIKNKGRIDSVYFCPDMKDSGSFFRKPAIGMGLMARKEFKNINFKKSIIIGDSISDMKFGKKLGMKTVFIADSNIKAIQHPDLIDCVFPSLIEFSKKIKIS